MSNYERGERRVNAKLTDDVVRAARQRFRDGWSLAALAAFYGVSDQTIHVAVIGRTWSHVPGAVPQALRPNWWRQRVVSDAPIPYRLTQRAIDLLA